MNLGRKYKYIFIILIPLFWFPNTSLFNYKYAKIEFIAAFFILLTALTSKIVYKALKHSKDIVLPLLAILTIGLFNSYLYYYENSPVGFSTPRQLLLTLSVFTVLRYIFLKYPNSHYFAIKIFIAVSFLIGVQLLLSLLLGFVPSGKRLDLNETNPNHLAVLALTSTVFIAIAVKYKLFSHKYRFIYYMTVVANFVIIYLSGSMGAAAMVIVSVAIYYFYRQKGIRRILGLISGLVASYLMYYALSTSTIYQNRVYQETRNENFSLSGRIPIWEAGIDTFWDAPILGSGFLYYQEKMVDTLNVVRSFHNEYLFILVSTGIVGFSGFVLVLFRIFKKIKSLKDTNLKVFALILFFIVLLSFSKGGGSIIGYLYWFILAFISTLSNFRKYNLRNQPKLIVPLIHTQLTSLK